MRRRPLLRGLAACALGVAARPGQAQSGTTLRFHTFMSATSQVWLSMLRPWMERIERASAGRLRFQAHASMQLGGAPAQLIDQVRDGTVDVVWTLPGYTPGRFPRVEAFELPFMMNHAGGTSQALWEYVRTQAPDEFREVRVLALNVHGPGQFHTLERPLRSVADLRGLKLRGPTRTITRLLGALGATPVGLPLPQIPEALSKGVIDGCVIPWEVAPSIRVHELCRHHSEFPAGAPALYTATFVLAMNRARYDALPADLQRVIDDHSGAETSALLGRTQQDNDRHGRQAALDRGNAIVTFGPTETAAFVERAADIATAWVAEMDQRGLPGRALLDGARALIARHGRG